MNVLINDVAADSSGALSVLMDFYREVINSNEDTLEWYFVVSSPQLLSVKTYIFHDILGLKAGYIGCF